MVYKGKYGKKNYAKMAAKAVKKVMSKPSSGVAIKSKKLVINPVLKSYVGKVVRRNIETKFHTNGIASSAPILGSGFNTTLNYGYTSVSSIIPAIQQGVGQQQRNGNRIFPVGRMIVKGYVLASPVNTTSNAYINTPFTVRIVVWRQKQNYTAVSNTAILDSGVTGAGNDFDGTLYNLMEPFNKDKFDIAAVRTFQLQPNSSAVGISPTENLSRYPVNRFFKMTVPLPRMLLYNDTGLDPQNCRWYLSAGIVQSNGTVIANTNTRATITADSIIYYTDA